MKDRFRLKVFLAAFWLFFTSSLIVWWMYFALKLLEPLGPSSHGHRNMLFLEGITLLALLLIGGCTLIYFIFQERRQRDILRDFFSSFSHDIKTALASLRLQTETLAEETLPDNQRALVDRLIEDSSRISVAVENSLLVGEMGAGEKDTGRLYLAKIDWDSLEQDLQAGWPKLKLKFVGFDNLALVDFVSDRGLLSSLLQNLISNAVKHGRATDCQLIVDGGVNELHFCFSDNGVGFAGSLDKLGEPYSRVSVSSGTGLGLNIVRRLIRRLGGRGPCFESAAGFSVHFSLPKKAAHL